MRTGLNREDAMHRTLLLVALTLPLIAAKPNPNPWEKMNEESDGIVIFARDVPNSGIKEVKAEILIDAPPARVWKVLLDSDHFIDFMPYVEEVKTVARDSASIWYLYQRLSPPLVSRRDYTLLHESTVDEANGIYVLQWRPANQKGPPPVDGVVRIDICEGSYTLEGVESGKKTHITYWLYTDPGGSIPRWIANKANTSSLPDLLRAIRNRTANPTWKRS
jgi:hypothetical protein